MVGIYFFNYSNISTLLLRSENVLEITEAAIWAL